MQERLCVVEDENARLDANSNPIRIAQKLALRHLMEGGVGVPSIWVTPHSRVRVMYVTAETIREVEQRTRSKTT